MKSKRVQITIWHYIRSFFILYLCLFAGNLISALLPFAVPGSIVGLLILFGLLAFQLIPLRWVKPGSNILLKNMSLLFIPIGVGVMNYYNLLSQQLFPIVLACVVSTFAVMALVAYCSHYVHRERPIIGAKPDKVEDVELAEQQDDDRALSEKKKC
ncbi:TPA: CidA/LrgA family protein [Proteus mirabilis]|nr:CidA/LrgA family protein [Proteus mirabilis]